MSKYAKYDDMTVAELKAHAAANDVEIPSDARKDEIIEALKKARIEPPEGKEGKEGEERDETTLGPRDKGVGVATTAEEPEPDPYENFADPVTDGTKPIINQIEPKYPVLALVIDGSNVLTIAEGPDNDHLVFVQSGVTQEWLTEVDVQRKFVQDKDGQIYYNSRGVAPSADFKPVDVVALGT